MESSWMFNFIDGYLCNIYTHGHTSLIDEVFHDACSKTSSCTWYNIGVQYLCITCMTVEGFGLHTTMIIVHKLRIKAVGVLTEMGGIIQKVNLFVPHYKGTISGGIAESPSVWKHL